MRLNPARIMSLNDFMAADEDEQPYEKIGSENDGKPGSICAEK